MPKLFVTAGSTSLSLDLFIQASTSTTGAGLTGLLGTSAGLIATYHRPGSTAVPVTITTGSLTQAYTTGLFVEIDSTKMPGFYRFDPPDTLFTTGVISASVMLRGAASMADLPLEVELTAFNLQNATPTVVLASQVHTGATIPVVQTASVALVANNVGTATTVLTVNTVQTGTVQLLAGTHTGAIIPQVQTASTLVGTVVLAGQVHTGAIVPLVQTASNLTGTVVLASQVHTGAVVPLVQTASNLINGITGTATVVLAAGTHTGAVIPVVQTASTLVNPVVLQTGTHTGAIIPQVNVVQTSADGRMANLDAAVSSRAATGAAMTLTTGERTAIANAYGTTTRPEAYRGSGAAGTPDQIGYELLAHLGQHNITSTGTVASKNLFKVDGTSSAERFDIQVDTSTQPTGISRA